MRRQRGSHERLASTCTPLIFPDISASEKFMRPSSADEFTQASAFIE